MEAPAQNCGRTILPITRHGADDINSGSGHSNPGNLMELLVGDTLYFSADDGSTGRELWAHNTSNNFTSVASGRHQQWRGPRRNPANTLIVIDERWNCSADDGSTGGELYIQHVQRQHPWLVADFQSQVALRGTRCKFSSMTPLFRRQGRERSGSELYAYRHLLSTWLVEDIYSGSVTK